MGPYSHYILAAKLEPTLQPVLGPDQRIEYLWGAVAPDIRYLANMRRDQTHLGQDRLMELMTCYPHLRSFLLGFQVHGWIDQMDVSQAIGAAFPLNIIQKALRKRISSQQMVMMVEMYYLQTETPMLPLCGNHNEVLTDLGITPDQSRKFQQALQEYFENRSFASAISAFQKIGWIQNSRVEKYLSVYRTMEGRNALRSLAMLSIKNARLDLRVMEHVRSGMVGRIDMKSA